jgi:hypothetical protein
MDVNMSNLTLPCKKCLLLGICKPIFKNAYIELYTKNYETELCEDRSITLLEIRCGLMTEYINYTGSGNSCNRKPKLKTATKFFIDQCKIDLSHINKDTSYDLTM